MTPIGYIGCCITADCVDGYHRLAAQYSLPDRFWPAKTGAETGHSNLTWWCGGQDIETWGKDPGTMNVVQYNLWLNGGNLWDGLFDDYFQAVTPASIFWVQACTHYSVSTSVLNAGTIQACKNLATLVPGATIYLSGLSTYPDSPCSIIGPDGPTRLQAACDGAVAAGVALAGPVMPPLYAGATTDGCHPTPTAALVQGQALHDFFDGL